MKKVVIGISGGVDSSVAAYLLKKDGYEVIGVTFLFTEDADPKDAIEVCQSLNIEHYIIDYKKEFKENIINAFINDYKKGLTPNPCILCNKTFKIKLLYEFLVEHNCDFIATGHYAKITENGLFNSYDLNKDQTYFLSEVPKHMLHKLILPLEGIDKPKVREIASSIGLTTANKKDSNDVCFINSKFNQFMQKELSSKPGDIINIDTNKVVGKHKGLYLYTIGQRRGLDIGGTKDKTFVVGKDLEKNILYICEGKDNPHLHSDSCLIENFNNLKAERITECEAKFRYRQDRIRVNITWLDDTTIKVNYASDTSAVTPGQACVLYKDNECLGGGTITEVYQNNERKKYL